MQKSIAVFLLAAVAAIPPLSVLADPITVPPGLSPGEQYRLAFVTSTTTPDTSTDIAYYNNFVTTVANTVPQLAALGTTWTAIGSTATVNADDNTDTNPTGPAGSPIYNLAGAIVAPTNQALWNTLSVPLVNSINIGQLGEEEDQLVATGTSPTGTATSAPLGDPLITQGSPVYTTSNWVSQLTEPRGNDPSYALSGLLTVPMPEPSTITLACLAAAGLAVPLLRRCRSSRPR